MHSGVHLGRVAGFEEAVGLGLIDGADGSSVPFHCVEIADGTRTIGVGSAVAFRRVDKLGATEACDVVALT